MKFRYVLILGLALVIAMASTAYAAPTLADVTTGTPETCNGTAVNTSVVAQGGNITPMNISGSAQTDAWQGFWGEITGQIILGDNDCNKMYNWSLANLSGEVYLSQSNAVVWATITGEQDCTTDEALTGTGSDRTNRTFVNSSLTNWDVGGVVINAACQTYTFVNNASQNVSFEEIILDDTTNIVYATKIYADTVGYDGVTHDYQIIVPDNTTSATTTYYVYVEFE